MTSLHRPQLWLALVVALVLVVVVGVVAVGQLRQVAQSVTTTVEPCAPSPCSAPQGFEVDIVDTANANGLLKLHVRFKNNTKPGGFEAVSYRHTSPADFQLRDAAGHQAAPVIDQQCANWPELDVNRGATAGPRLLCFTLPPSGLKGAQLVWSPDLGFLFDSVQIPLG